MQEKSIIYADFYRRLKQTIDKHGLTISGVENKLGIGRGTLDNAIKKGAALGIDKVFKILAMFPYEDLNWLFKGEEPEDIDKILKDNDDKTRNKVSFIVNEPPATYGNKAPAFDIDKINRTLKYQAETIEEMHKQIVITGRMAEAHDSLLEKVIGRLERLEGKQA